MSVEAALGLLAIAIAANAALLIVRRDALRRDPARSDTPGTPDTLEPDGVPAAPTAGRTPDAAIGLPDDPDLRPHAVQRVVRVTTWLFLLTATVVVAASDLWVDRRGPILVVIAVGVGYQLVLHDVLATRLPGLVLQASEGAFAIALAGLLVGLTGGVDSPFYVAFPLITGGTALVVAPASALVLAAAAAASHVVAASGAQAVLDARVLAEGAVQLVAIVLLAYVGVAIGREQRHVRERAFRLATVDGLTGLRTRAHLFGALGREVERSRRTGRRFCLLMLDLDNLKQLNDRHGHLVGDAALRAVGDTIGARIRRIDTGARYGGDEFAVLLPETDPTGGWVLAEKIRAGVAATVLVPGSPPVRPSVSVGVVAFPDDGAAVGELLGRADDAMYRAKREGRDRVVGAPSLGEAARSGVGGDPV